MIIEPATSVDIAAGTGPSLLVSLARAKAPEPTGEIWLNLFGVPLDAGAPYTHERLLEALSGLDPVELRRQVLGRYAWSWCDVRAMWMIRLALKPTGIVGLQRSG